MEKESTNNWIIVGHPQQLPLAVAIAGNVPKRSFHLIISGHKYWKSINLDEYRRFFKSITIFEPIYHTHGLKELLLTIIRLFRTKRAIQKLPVRPGDILLSLEVWDYVENLITTVWNKNQQVFLCPEAIYQFVCMSRNEISKTKSLYITKSGYIHHYLVEPLLRLKKRTFYYWAIRDQSDTHGIAYSKPLAKLYDKVFVLKSIFERTVSENEIYYPYPLLKNLFSSNQSRERIVFFLSGIIKTENFYGKVNQILKTLRKIYQDKYLLEIRLHPNEPEEYKKIYYDGWVINRDAGNGEQYLLRHAGEIAAAFTHISTISIFSLNLNIPSYNYYRCMGLDKEYIEWYDYIFKAAPKEFFLQSLTAAPEPYEIAAEAVEKAQFSLDKLYGQSS